MKWNKKRSCLVLLSAVLCGMVVFLKPEADLKAEDNTVTTGLPQGKSLLGRANLGIDNPPKRLNLEGIFTLPQVSDSSIEDNVVVITQDIVTQEGAIWSSPGNMMDLTKNFEFEATLFFGNKANKNGDGMTFAMHNDPERLTSKRGINGEKLGVYGGQYNMITKDFTVGALANSFIVEFDTYINSDASDKNNAFPDPHVAYSFPDKNSSYWSGGSGKPSIHKHLGAQYFKTLATNEWTTFAMNWNVTTKTLTYQFGKGAPVEVVLDVQDVFKTDQVYWGFTGSTGASSQQNRAAFTKVPGLVEAENNYSIRDKSGNSVADKIVTGRQVLTYEMEATYLSGKQNWLDVHALITDNPYVEYLPGTLKVDGTTVNEAEFFATKNVALGNLSLASPKRKLTFDVRTKDLPADQEINEVFSFHGDNYMDDKTVSYTIAKSEIKDGITIDPIQSFNTSQKITGTWQLENIRELKEVQYQINSGAWVTLPQADYGLNVAAVNNWNVTLSQGVIDGLDITKQHTFKIKGVPVVLASGQTDIQATETFAIKPQGLTVTGQVTDSDTSIKGTGTPGLTVQLKNAQGTVIKEAVVGSNGDYILTPLTAFSEGTKLTVSQKSPFSESDPLAITVSAYVVPLPVLVVEDEGKTVTLVNGVSYDIKAKVSGSEKDNLVVKYAINGVVNESLTKVVANPTANDVHDTIANLPATSLPVGTHRISVSVEWQKTGVKVTASDINLTVVSGGLRFIKVSEATSFEQGKITNKAQTLARQNDWNIQIEDNRGKGSQTTLYAKLSTTFKNKDNRVISNPLKYVNEQNQEITMPVGSSVKVFQKETTENIANVDVSWQKNQGILFDLKPGNFQGEYTADIEWLLSDTP